MAFSSPDTAADKALKKSGLEDITDQIYDVLASVSPEDAEMIISRSATTVLALQHAAARLESERAELASRSSTPETVAAATSITEWKARTGERATESEVLTCALLFVARASSMPTGTWVQSVLESQGEAERTLGDEWAPPRSDSLWAPNGALLNELNACLNVGAIDCAKLRAVAAVVAQWMGDGATAQELPASDIFNWARDCRHRSLLGPRRSNGKTAGSPRHVNMAVRVARLLWSDERSLKGAYHAALAAALAAAHAREPAERPASSLSKAELMAREGELEQRHADEMAELREEHAVELNNLQEAVDGAEALADSLTARALSEKKKRLQAVARGKAPRAKANARWKEKVNEMKDAWKQAAIEVVEAAHGSAMLRLKELKAEAHAAKRAALAAATKAEKLSGKRLENFKAADELASDLQQRVRDLEDALHEGAADAIEKLDQIRALKTEGRGAGQNGRWWPWWVRAMIMEQLINGTPPTAIPANIASDAAYLVPFLEVHTPSVRLCRRMRGELRIVSETLAAYRIATALNWRQLFTDGTSRRQTALLTAIIAIDGPDGELLPIILRAAFVVTGETAEQQVADILEKAIKRGGAKLKRLREVFEELFPGVAHDIPVASEMDVAKLGNGGMITSDNCPTAMKVKRLLKEEVQLAVCAKYDSATWESFSEKEKEAKLLVLEGDCWNHLRNVWLGATTTALTARLKETLDEELKAIDFRLRVGTDMVLVLRAADKEFSLCANYPKGHGDLFRHWIRRVHPKALLLHLIQTAGSRQDLAFDGAGAIYLNRRYWVEFLDERLRVPGVSNILQECLFIMFTSVEMIANSRIHAIIDLAIVLPMRWLAGKTHTLAEFDWSERSNGRALDLLEPALAKVSEDGKLMLDDSFMMSIFDPLMEELPPFKEYIKYMYDEKAMAMAGCSITEHQFRRLRDELFNPTDEDNRDSTEMAIELGALAATTMLTEIRDAKKATSRHLSSADGALSWGNTSVEEHAASLRKMATDDPSESSFGGITRELTVAGRVDFGGANGVVMGRRNKDWVRGIKTEARKSSAKGSKAKLETMGVFHSISVEMREALITMASRDYPSECEVDRSDLEGQRAARQRKEELASEVGREKASEKYIDALYYYEMWDSAACWKTVAKAKKELDKLSSKSAKLEALKEQIRIRVDGLGWADLSCAWSSGGVAFSPDELMAHLTKIISEQTKRTIPSKPPVPGLERKELPALGKRTADVAALDAKESASNAALEAEARATKADREAKGFGDSYQQRQGSRPELDERLIGKRIEVVFPYVLREGVFGEALMWCSGEVVGLDPRPYTDYPKGKSAMVKWDANNRLDPPEPISTHGAKLLPTRWNKDGFGAWRFDLDPPPA